MLQIRHNRPFVVKERIYGIRKMLESKIVDLNDRYKVCMSYLLFVTNSGVLSLFLFCMRCKSSDQDRVIFV